MKGKRIPISPRVQELQKRRKESYRKRMLLRVVLVFLLLGSLILLFNVAALKVSMITVDPHLRDAEKIQQYLNEELSKRIFFVLPKKSIIFLPKKEMQTKLLTAFPILESVEVSLNKKIIKVSGSERVPQYLYCGSAPTENFGQESCELVDIHGFDFRPAPIFSGPVYFTFYITGMTESLLGKTILPPETFDRLKIFKDSLKEEGIIAKGVIVGNDMLTLLISRPGENRYGKIMFPNEKDITGLIADLKLVIQNEPLKSHIAHPETIEYIDMRYKDKVYYKFKE